MDYKRVFSCSCFIDQAIWFINTGNFSWQFDTFVYKNGNVSDEIFIYDKKYNIINENFIYYRSRIIVCCLDCIELVMRLSSNDSDFCSLLLEIDCDYTYDDWLLYDEEKIFYGNGNIIPSKKITFHVLMICLKILLKNIQKKNVVSYHCRNVILSIFVLLVENFL